MDNGRNDTTDIEAVLLARLPAALVDYRHALAILDPEYREWRPEGNGKAA
jgi:hypothetical protein